MDKKTYNEILLIIDENISDETIKTDIIKAFEYYKEVTEAAENDDLFFLVHPEITSGEDVFKNALKRWNVDLEKLNVIRKISETVDNTSFSESVVDMIAISLENEDSKCFVIDNKLGSFAGKILVNTLGVKKKNEYTIKLLGKSFIEFFLNLPRDRQIQLFDSLNGKNQSIENAAADILYRIDIEDLVSPTDNIPNFKIDDDMTIGVELETIGKASNLLLHKSDYLIGDKRTILGDSWIISKDDTLGCDGLEVISPVMNNTNEYPKQLYGICKFLQLIGNSANERCGGHIHIGADYFKSKYALANLYEIIGNCEEIYYLVTCEEGKFEPSRIDTVIQPISGKLKLAIENGNVNIQSQYFVNQLKKLQGTMTNGENKVPIKNYSINVLNYGRLTPVSPYGQYRHTAINTLEFRAFTNPDTYNGWVQNINLAAGIMKISEKLGQIDSKKEKTEEEKELIKLRERLKEDIQSSEKIEYFLDLIFEDEAEKEIYRKRFFANYKILQKEENAEIGKKLAFHKIDFGKRAIEAKNPDFEDDSR